MQAADEPVDPHHPVLVLQQAGGEMGRAAGLHDGLDDGLHLLGLLPLEGEVGVDIHVGDPVDPAELGDAGALGHIVYGLLRHLGEQVPIPGAVDDDLGQHRLAAGFGLHHDALDLVPLHDGLRHPAVEQQLRAGFQHHGVHFILGDLRIDDGGVQGDPLPVPVPADIEVHHVGVHVLLHFLLIRAAPVFLLRIGGAVPGRQPVDQLLAEAADGLSAVGVPQVGDDVHQAAGAHAAQMAVPLDEQGLRPAPGCGDRRGDAAGAAAHHAYVHLPKDVYIPCRLGNGFHAVCDLMLELRRPSVAAEDLAGACVDRHSSSSCISIYVVPLVLIISAGSPLVQPYRNILRFSEKLV